MKFLQPTSCLLLCSQEVIKTNLNVEWETPATGGVVAQWVYLLTVSLQLLQMNPSAFYAYTLCWRNEPYESCLSQLALTWMRAVLTGLCPRLQVLLPRPPQSLCHIPTIMFDLFWWKDSLTFLSKLRDLIQLCICLVKTVHLALWHHVQSYKQVLSWENSLKELLSSLSTKMFMKYALSSKAVCYRRNKQFKIQIKKGRQREKTPVCAVYSCPLFAVEDGWIWSW